MLLEKGFHSALFLAGVLVWLSGGREASAQAAPPVIELVSVPRYGERPGTITGRVRGVDNPASVRVAPLIFISGLGFYTKPTCAQRTVPIESDGSFSALLTTGGVDETATIIFLLLVPANSQVPCVEGAAGIPENLDAIALAKRVVQRPDPDRRMLSFSGERFSVKAATAPVGPGPNRFSDSRESVFVDGDGYLRLRLRLIEGQWYSSEIVSERRVGYGRYTITFVVPRSLHPCQIVGLSSYAETELPSREIDAIEIGSFCNPSLPGNSQNVVQPFDVPGNLQRFGLPEGAVVTQVMEWSEDRIAFQAFLGNSSSGAPFHEWLYQGNVPSPDADVRFRANFWWFDQAEQDRPEAEVVIRSFTYEPEQPANGEPTIAAIVNAASYDGLALAPCSVFSVFGERLSAQTEPAATLPLPQALAETSVLFNGSPVPLLYANNGQLNGQAPCDMTSDGATSVVVQAAAGGSTPFPIHIEPSAGGIFRYDDGACIAADPLFELITDANPAAPGSIFTIYVTGLGRVEPPIPAGEAAPLSPLSFATEAFEAEVGDAPANILYLGAAPGQVGGVGQVNIQLPEVLPSERLTLRLVPQAGGIVATCLLPVGSGPLLPPAGPIVNSVTPSAARSGEVATIRGENFAQGAQVFFGSAAATSVVVSNAMTIQATVPQGSGQLGVTVRNPDGQESTLANSFTYLAPAPTLTSISPNSGMAGTQLTIGGSNFASGAQVLIGSTAATAVTVNNSTTIRATAPPGSGQASVTVRNPDGQQTTFANAFTYLAAAPVVTSINPASGAAGAQVTILGANFISGAQVFFGSAAATGVAVSNATTIQATAPNGSGTVNVRVRNPDGQQGTLATAFTYIVGPPSIQAVVVGCRIRGQAQNVTPATARVVVYVRTNLFYLQPCITEPLQTLNTDLTFGPIDSHPGQAYALLVGPGYSPPATMSALPAVDGANVLAISGLGGTVASGCDVARCLGQ